MFRSSVDTGGIDDQLDHRRDKSLACEGDFSPGLFDGTVAVVGKVELMAVVEQSKVVAVAGVETVDEDAEVAEAVVV